MPSGSQLRKYAKPRLNKIVVAKKLEMEVTQREAQAIARLRQLYEAGRDRAEVELRDDGPRVREQAGLTSGRMGV